MDTTTIAVDLAKHLANKLARIIWAVWTRDQAFTATPAVA